MDIEPEEGSRSWYILVREAPEPDFVEDPEDLELEELNDGQQVWKQVEIGTLDGDDATVRAGTQTYDVKRGDLKQSPTQWRNLPIRKLTDQEKRVMASDYA